MMIHRYVLQVEDLQSLYLPKTRQFLTVQMKDNALSLWFIVNEKSPMQKVQFRVYGTGTPITAPLDSISYLGTVQEQKIGAVWHVFEGVT